MRFPMSATKLSALSFFVFNPLSFHSFDVQQFHRALKIVKKEDPKESFTIFED